MSISQFCFPPYFLLKSNLLCHRRNEPILTFSKKKWQGSTSETPAASFYTKTIQNVNVGDGTAAEIYHMSPENYYKTKTEPDSPLRGKYPLPISRSRAKDGKHTAIVFLIIFCRIVQEKSFQHRVVIYWFKDFRIVNTDISCT